MVFRYASKAFEIMLDLASSSSSKFSNGQLKERRLDWMMLWWRLDAMEAAETRLLWLKLSLVTVKCLGHEQPQRKLGKNEKMDHPQSIQGGQHGLLPPPQSDCGDHWFPCSPISSRCFFPYPPCPWYLPRYVRIGCRWAVFAICLDP